MATVVDQQPIFKHFCRICKKGFGCGRALGGHMRAHGIGDENGHIEDEDPACSDWDDKLAGGGNNNQPPGNKRMYALRTNPNRLKSCRICENCGKEFVSWKSFLEHGKCNSADANESLVSSPTGSDYEEDGAAATKRDYTWSKGKRSRRAKIMGTSISNCPSSEEEDLAHCLVLLSTARVDPLIAEAEESCASASKEEEQRRNPVINAMLPSVNIRYKAKGVANKGLFECKACKKVFNSHQALGGHRASHKKVKGCFAANLDDLDDSIMDEDVITNDELTIFSKSTAILQLEHPSHHQSQMAMAPKRKSKVHECSICHRIFSSGQALGGHKRCHWLTSNSSDTSSISRFHQLQDHQSQHFHQRSKLNKSEPLDLNLPAPIDDTAARVRQDHENTLTFQVPTEIFLQPWIGVHANDENNDTITNKKKKNVINSSIQNSLDDEAESKVKLAKLSDLKGMGSGSSPWLQVGIGSTSNMGSDP